MANSYIGTFVNPTSITCYYGDATIQAGFPKENVLNYDYPLRPVKGTSASAATIKMRFYLPTVTNTTPIVGVLIRDTNFGFFSVHTSTSSANMHASTHVESLGVITCTEDTRTARYNGLLTYKTVSTSLMTLSSTATYWQINQSATTPCFNSADYPSIGSIYFITSWEKVNLDWQLPFRTTRVIPTMRTDRASGGAKVVTVGPPRVSISFPAAAITVASSDPTSGVAIPGGEVQQYGWQELDKHRGFLFWEFRNNEKMSRIYHVRQTPEFTVEYQDVDAVMQASFEVEEIV